jgi:GntR family transcriptional regulator / MocR family aminotransferase
VVYAGTTSKTVAPGLRIAWIVVPAELVAPLRESTRWDEAYVNVIDQLVLAHLMRTGELDRHLRRCRTRYRRRRDRLGDAITTRLPAGRLSGIAAGLHAVLQLPGGDISETALLRHLSSRGVAVDGISYFYDRPSESPLGLIIGYATPPEHAYGHALETLVDALREHNWPIG